MADAYSTFSATPQSFGRMSALVTPSDSVDLPNIAKAVVCLTSGNIEIVPAGNSVSASVTFVGVSPGFIPPFQVRRVRAAGTTCSVATVED